MSSSFAFEIGLASLVLAIGAWTVSAREASVAVIAFVSYGLLLAIVWVALSAIDVALTEAAIGSGLTGAMLLGAASRLGASETAAVVEHPGTLPRLTAALLSSAVTVLLVAAVLLLPDPAPTLAPAAAENAGRTGLLNPVTNVLIAFRAMDTFLEKVVLVLGLVGVWSLAPDGFWGGRPGPRYHPEPDSLLVFFARLLPPIGIVVGVHVLWVSSDYPGGAFQGATIFAAMWLLVAMAGLVSLPHTNDKSLRLSLVAGPSVFLIVGLGGLWFGEAFLAYPVSYAKPLIVMIEVGMTLTVAVMLCMLFIGPSEGERS